MLGRSCPATTATTTPTATPRRPREAKPSVAVLPGRAWPLPALIPAPRPAFAGRDPIAQRSRSSKHPHQLPPSLRDGGAGLRLDAPDGAPHGRRRLRPVGDGVLAHRLLRAVRSGDPALAGALRVARPRARGPRGAVAHHQQ